jgi:serine/threonine-protein kinase
MSEHKLAHEPCLELFLSGQLTADDQRQIEAHLESCPDCLSRLQSAAADDYYYNEIPSFLSTDDFDCDFTTGSLALDRPSSFAIDDRPEILRITEYLDPTDDPRMLGRFGGYEIAGIIGSGGMGIVLKGFETALDRYVAIKILAPHLATSGAARSRFAREAKAAAAVLHENIVSIHRVAEANGLPFLVMPYIPGDSLVKRIDDRGPLELREILRIGMQIAAGLAAAHAQGLVHRDIKPANILLGSGIERVTITDFGLARAADDASLTRSGVITGTPQFMSPEQASGEPVDVRSDLFSLGSVLYAMCTGRPPFRADTAWGVMRRISDTNPRPIRELAPDVPDWLAEIVQQLHAKKVDDRFQSATEVADLLGRWLSHLEQPATFPAPARVAKAQTKWLRYIKPRWVAAAVATIAATAVLLAFRTSILTQAESRVDEAVHAKLLEYQHAWETTSETNEQLTTNFDEQRLFNDYNQLGTSLDRIDRSWSQSPATSDSMQQELTDIRARLDKLSQDLD